MQIADVFDGNPARGVFVILAYIFGRWSYMHSSLGRIDYTKSPREE